MPQRSDVRLEYLLRERVRGDGDHVEGRCALAFGGVIARREYRQLTRILRKS